MKRREVPDDIGLLVACLLWAGSVVALVVALASRIVQALP